MAFETKLSISVDDPIYGKNLIKNNKKADQKKLLVKENKPQKKPDNKSKLQNVT